MTLLRVRELVSRAGLHVIVIFILELLLAINAIINYIKLRSAKITPPIRLLRALSFVIIKKIHKVKCPRLKEYVKTLYLIQFIPDGSHYLVPDIHSISLLWHVRVVKDYDRVLRGDFHVVIDVGAHVGFYVVHVIKRFKKMVKIFAYEPHPLNYALLRQNVALNDAEEIVLCYPYAVSSYNGIAYLILASTSGGHMLTNEEIRERCRRILVMTIGLDSMLNNLKQCITLTEPKILLKIDVEGHELEVLQGATKLIEKYKPYIVAEVRRKSIKSIQRLIVRRLGYKCYLTPFGKGYHLHCIP